MASLKHLRSWNICTPCTPADGLYVGCRLLWIPGDLSTCWPSSKWWLPKLWRHLDHLKFFGKVMVETLWNLQDVSQRLQKKKRPTSSNQRCFREHHVAKASNGCQLWLPPSLKRLTTCGPQGFAWIPRNGTSITSINIHKHPLISINIHYLMGYSLFSDWSFKICVPLITHSCDAEETHSFEDLPQAHWSLVEQYHLQPQER